MQTDAITNFIAPGAVPQSVVGAAGIEIQLGQTLDLLGNGVGQAPTDTIGNTTVWGADPGIGREKPVIQINIGTGFTTGTSATGTFRLEYAADQGAAGAYQPSTWYVSSETMAHAVGVLVANAKIRMDLTPAPPEVPNPRFVRLTVYPASGADFTAGTVTFAGLVTTPDDQANKNQAANYVVA